MTTWSEILIAFPSLELWNHPRNQISLNRNNDANKDSEYDAMFYRETEQVRLFSN